MDDERDDDNFSESDTDQNLVVQGAANNGKKRLRRRSSEEQGARVFSHQLRGMSESDKHVKKIDDMTLWDRIMKDKRMARSEKRHLGSSYYNGPRAHVRQYEHGRRGVDYDGYRPLV